MYDGATSWDRLLTPEEAAERLRFAPRTLRDARVRRRLGLRAVRLGKRLRFRERDLLQLLRPTP